MPPYALTGNRTRREDCRSRGLAVTNVASTRRQPASGPAGEVTTSVPGLVEAPGCLLCSVEFLERAWGALRSTRVRGFLFTNMTVERLAGVKEGGLWEAKLSKTASYARLEWIDPWHLEMKVAWKQALHSKGLFIESREAQPN
jgi:hypothetical protein